MTTIKQKVISIVAGAGDEIINNYLEDGWLVKKIVTERVSVSSGQCSQIEKGKIVFLLEKTTY